MIKEEVITAFETEFSFVKHKFEQIDLLANGSIMDRDVIWGLKLPNETYNIVWHPGVYVFIGNDKVYRVGVSINNSRERVMQHLDDWTSLNGHCIWDIDKHDDKSILLFNVKDKADIHWLLSIELFLERKFKPLIGAKRWG